MTISSGKRVIGRLTNRKEFLAVQKGLRLRGPYFLLEVAERQSGDGPARVGYTVTRKQGNSVERNRIRRRLREGVRCHAALPFSDRHDYVLVARRDALDASFAELEAALEKRIADAGKQIRKFAKTKPVA